MPQIKTDFLPSKKQIIQSKPYQLAQRNSLLLLSVLLLILFGLIVVGNILRSRNNGTEETAQKPLAVEVYRVGQAPRVQVLAQVEKNGVVRVMAQSAGIIQKVYVKEGEKVNAHQTLAYISTNYQGASSQTIQRQIAERQKNNINDTYNTQKELIEQQREIAKTADDNSDELREINENSIGRTEDVLDLNNEIISSLEDQLSTLEAATPSANTDSMILSTKSSLMELLAANNELESGLEQLRYQTDEDNPPSELSDLQKEIALKQLDISEKSLDLQKEVAGLQYRLAVINESLAYPSAYCDGVIEEVHVRPGQAVTPGTLLFTLSTNSDTVTAIAHVSSDIAANVSQLEPSRLHLGESSIELLPAYVSNEATQGLLYAVTFAIPEEYQSVLTDYESVPVDIPVGYPDTETIMPFIPLESVYQNSERNFIFIVQDGVAVVREVHLGKVYGNYVEVTEGLADSDQIILDRTVIEGDLVEIIN